MLKISSKMWIRLYLTIQLIMLALVAGIVIYIDPFFHYHRPWDDTFYYTLDNQRSQNNGITRNFDYDMLITGTSMTENFKTSEANELFNVCSIKVPYSGGSYKEINDSVKVAIENNIQLKVVLRSLDMSNFYENKDNMRDDLGEYPTYLNNNNIFDDVKYVYNRDVVFTRCAWMVRDVWIGGRTGITSFDDYSNWMPFYTEKFGKDVVLEGHALYGKPIGTHYLSDEEKEIIRANIEQNVTTVAKENQNIQFYYFFPPYSAAWWGVFINQEILENR